MNVRAAVLDDFKTLVRQQGMSDDTIIIKQNKGTTQRRRLPLIALTFKCEKLRPYVNEQ